MGLLVLKIFEKKSYKQFLRWIALGIYAACMIFGILFNIMNSQDGQRFKEKHFF